MGLFCKKQKHITVDVNIDYEKLAQEIVKAQKEASRQEKRPNRFRGSLMGGLNILLYSIITLFGIGMAIGVWLTPIGGVGEKIVYSVLFGMIGLFSIGCAVESFRDTDENAQQHFNTNIALVALIVALIALFKGVG